jgi:O-6-methylguanine DNA methyltransferase
MDESEQGSIGEVRQMLGKLRNLDQAKAPKSLLATCLARCGLADAYARLETPIGRVFVAYNETGISAVMRAQSGAEFERLFEARFGRQARDAGTLPRDLEREVRRLARGGRANLRFDLRGLSEFERAVLQKALEIPRGEVRPYAWIAREIGRPKAARAVGSALASNPVPLLIPCHRVVHSDGHIGNYIFGSERKRAVLEAEGAGPDVIERLASAGVHYFADDRDGTFCLPTCGGMHLRNDPQLKPYRSEQAALAAGYRPCSSCRPIGLV